MRTAQIQAVLTHDTYIPTLNIHMEATAPFLHSTLFKKVAEFSLCALLWICGHIFKIMDMYRKKCWSSTENQSLTFRSDRQSKTRNLSSKFNNTREHFRTPEHCSALKTIPVPSLPEASWHLCTQFLKLF